jgi:hypothetical protein
MMLVQSLRGIGHNKIEDTREDHLEMSVVALDRLATKAENWILRYQKRQIANHWVIATTNMAEVFSQWTTQKKAARPMPNPHRAGRSRSFQNGEPPKEYFLRQAARHSLMIYDLFRDQPSGAGGSCHG